MKNKTFYISVLGILVLFSCQKVDFDQAQKDSFVKFYGSQYHNSANDVIEINTDYFVAGYSNQIETQTSGMIFRTNEYGNTQWDYYLTPNFGDYEFNGITLGNDGSIVVCGKYTDTTGSSDILVAKFSFDGALIWENTFGGLENQEATQIVSANDGGYVLVGSTTLANAGNTNPAGEFDVLVVKIDELGDSVAANQFGGFDRDIGSDLIPFQGSQYLIVGTTESFDGAYYPNHQNKLIYMLVLSNQLLEDDALTHGDNQNQTAHSISLDNNGNLMIAGSYETIGGAKQGMVFNLNITNIRDTLNVRTYNSNGAEEFYDVQQQTDGSICASGFTTTPDGIDKMCVFKINGSDYLDELNFELGYEEGAYGRNLIPASNGGFLITGASLWKNNQKAVLIKVNENVEL